MKPTVIVANQNSPTGSGGGGGSGNGNISAGAGINIPINREYVNQGSSPQQHQQQYPQQQPQIYKNQQAYGSPRQQYQPHPQYQQVPTNQPQQYFQPTFGFEPDMDMDMDNMFPRSRLGRLHNDPFANFGGTHFGFPQFSTMGRRGRVAGGANNHMDHEDDFFNRLPSEFRQYIPEGFGARRATGSNLPQQPPQHPHQQQPQQQPQYYQQDYGIPQQQAPVQAQQVPQSPSKRLCDAAIQTEDPAGRSEVDCVSPVSLNQHGLRNTMDMGIKSVAEQEQALRSHSAPPPEQQQLNQQYQQQHQQQEPQIGTQTSPPVQQSQPPQFHKTYYAPQTQAHPQQKQQTPPPPQTPGGSYVRTIPIFVEGRTEPIINAHKDIPNQNAAPEGQPQVHTQAHFEPSQQQQHSHQQQRPGPLHTQQESADQQAHTDAGAAMPPQTPHTMDSIKKIQDIQRDVLELMAKVEQFKGTRQDKEYVYLDEMLTRNLLKLDTIDTNGKDSIRLARKEAIKCIQASVNVLDAKAEENGRSAAATEVPLSNDHVETKEVTNTTEAEGAANEAEHPATPQPLDATKIQEPIPLPPPPNTAESTVTQANDPPSTIETRTVIESSE